MQGVVRPIHLAVAETVLHGDILGVVESHQNRAASVEGLVHIDQVVADYKPVVGEEAFPIDLVEVVSRTLPEGVDSLVVGHHNPVVMVGRVEEGSLPDIDSLLEADLDYIDQEEVQKGERTLAEENLTCCQRHNMSLRRNGAHDSEVARLVVQNNRRTT